MSYTYAAKRHSSVVHQNPQTAPAAPSLDALRAGIVQPTEEQLGRPVDLPGAIQAKMEAAFGADLSAVRLYESQAVADAGAEAVAQGSRIAFAPGKLDFASSSGQALLGHELSHVVSQARGEVTGSGFLRDAALEARADREGALAAAGESVYSGPVTTALSDASAAPAAGPMQASKAQPEWETQAGIASKWHPFKRGRDLLNFAIDKTTQPMDSDLDEFVQQVRTATQGWQESNPADYLGFNNFMKELNEREKALRRQTAEQRITKDLPSKYHPFKRNKALERYLARYI